MVTITLIALNTLVFILEATLPKEMHFAVSQNFGMIPQRITSLQGYLTADISNPAITIFTAMFLHGDIFHLLGNMLYLWIFGDNVEDAMGHLRFVFFYLICGIAAGAAQVAAAPDSVIPMIGASGAIAGVLGAYLILHPFARIHTLIIIIIFIRIIYLPAILVLSVWFFIQIFSSLTVSATEGGGVAWYAHIGGFTAGFLLIRMFQKKRPLYIRVRH